MGRSNQKVKPACSDCRFGTDLGKGEIFCIKLGGTLRDYEFCKSFRINKKKENPAQKKTPEIKEHITPAPVVKTSDSGLWAKSTLVSKDSKDLTNIYIIKQEEAGGIENIRNKAWIHDLLDDNHIPYFIEIKGFRPSKRVYIESQWIYVERKNGIKASFLISEYMDPKNRTSSGTWELETSHD